MVLQSGSIELQLFIQSAAYFNLKNISTDINYIGETEAVVVDTK